MIEQKSSTKNTFFLFLLFVLLIIPDLQAQNNTNSPFSIFEIGEIEFRDFGSTAGMGNVGIGVQSENFLNRRNPAALTTIDTLRFVFDVAAAIKFSEFSTKENSARTNNFNFKSLAAGLRISKRWTSSVGLKPFSSVGYNIKDQQYVEGSENNYDNVFFTGSGGLNNFYWANAYEILPGLSLGLTSSYLFGNVAHNIDTDVYSVRTTHNISKIHFDFGLQYSHLFGNHTNITVGGIYVNEAKIDIHRSKVVYSTTAVEQDQRLPDLNLRLPQTYGAGFSVNRNKRDAELLFAADYQFSNWSTNLVRYEGLTYTDSHIYSAGLQITPNVNRFENYFQIIRYSIGACYNRSYLKVNGHQLNDFSISFGLGFPFTNQLRTISYVNLAVNVGESGTGKRGGITERYVLVSANMSLIDRWFAKRQWD